MSNPFGVSPVILKPAIETANHAKYAYGQGLGEKSARTQWVNDLATVESRFGPLLSRGSYGSRFIPTAVSWVIYSSFDGLGRTGDIEG